MRKLYITKAKDRYDRGIAVGAVTWPQLAGKLGKFERTSETFEEYKLSENKLAIKDTGWFIGGPLKPVVRRKANLKFRDVLTLDADHLEPEDVDNLIEYFGDDTSFVCHSSHSHSKERPRLRFVFPFTRPVRPEEYEPVARMVAAGAGIELFDDTTFQFSRVMFWPSASSDGDVFWHDNHEVGRWIDPDEVLAKYKDWRDWGTWPTSSREKLTRDPQKKAESPYEKPGVIGAFCRVYEIPHAIEEFDLPYSPSGMGEGRYSYAGGTSVDGAIYYPDDGHLYSWHESDPARGNHNAWDLVRIHLFGDKDVGVSDDTPMGNRESQRHMQVFAMDLPEVAAEMAAADGLEVLDDADEARDTDSKPDAGKKPADNDLTFDGIRRAISGRSAPFSREDRDRTLRHIAAAGLNKADQDGLLKELRDALPDEIKVSVTTLRDTLRSVRGQMMSQTTNGTPVDIQFDMMERVLDDWWQGGEHIRRFQKQFWCYENGVWVTREDEHVRAAMQQSFFQLRKDKPKDALALVAAVGAEDTSTLTSRLWTMFCAHVNGLDHSRDPMRLRELQPRPVINVANGHLEFNRRGQQRLVPHDPSMFLTGQVPVEYDPEADTSHWDAFCELLFHDSIDPDDDKRHLEEVAGYVLQPWRDLPSVFIMKGRPAAGKSTFGMVLNRLLGDGIANQALGGYDGSNTHATAGLVGKLLLLDEDFNAGQFLPDGFLKRVSEAKYMTANPKNKGEFEFVCRAAPMIICNDWPRTRDHSGALDRRLIAWDLPSIPVDKQDDDARRALLSAGLAGCLRRFVEGFARLYQRGKWDVPISCMMAAKTWHVQSDAVAYWLSETFEINLRDTSSFVPRPEMWGLFRQHMRESGLANLSYGKKKFFERVGAELGAFSVRQGVRGWTGLTRKSLEDF